MDGLPTQVAPRQHRLTVRDRQFVLIAMGGSDLLDWAELQVLAALEKVKALHLEPDEDRLRDSLRRLFMADSILVCKALGCDEGFFWELTVDEKREVIEAQDALNRMDTIGPALQTNQLLAAALAAQGGAVAQ